MVFLKSDKAFQSSRLGWYVPITGQPESALLALRLVFSLAPLLLMGIGIFVSYQYKICEKRHGEINEAIRIKIENLDKFKDILLR